MMTLSLIFSTYLSSIDYKTECYFFRIELNEKDMKRFLLAFSLVTVLSFSHSNNTIQAQGVSINVNIGNQPAWGPVGYDYASYYYLPDIDVYYDVNRSYFYYWDRGGWRSARYLPYSYGQYDLYGMYKVVINQPNPWMYNDYYRREYGRYRGNRSQVIILNSPDRRYDRVRYNRVDWINSGRPGRYPNYHNQHPGYGRPNNNRPNHNGGGYNNGRPDNNRPKPNDKYSGNNSRPNYNGGDYNNGRSDNNRPKPNDKYSGNNDRPSSRPNSSARNDQSRTSSRSPQNQEVRSSGRSSSTTDRSTNSASNGRSSNSDRVSNRR